MPVDLHRPLSRPPLALVIWALLWWAPFAVTRHTLPLTSFYGEALAALLGCVGTFVTLLPFVRRTPVSGTTLPRLTSLMPLAVPFGLWTLWVLLQPLLVPMVAPRVNLFVALGMGAVLVTLVGGAVSRRAAWSAGLEPWIAHTLVIGGLLTVLGQLLQLTGMDEMYSLVTMVMAPGTERRLFGNLGQANHAATYLAFALAALVFLVQTRRWPLLAGLLVASVLSLGEAFTVSRTPWGQVLLIAGMGLASAWAWPLPDRPLRAGRWRQAGFPLILTPLLIGISTLVSWANQRWGWGLATSAWQRFQDVHQMSPRMALWRSGWTLWRDHPWAGIGWGDYPWQQYQAVLAIGPVEPATSAHNLVLDLLVKAGLPGAALVLLPLVWWVWRQTRASGSPERVLGWTMLGILGIHALVEFPENYLYFLLPAAWLMGRWSRLEPDVPLQVPSEKGPGTTWTGWIVGGLALLGALGTVGVADAYRQAERDLSEAQIPVLGLVSAPTITGPARLFAPWIDALAWPHVAQGLATTPGRFQAPWAVALTLAPGVSSMRVGMLALARAGRLDDAQQAAQRWHLFAQGERQWPDERRAALRDCSSDPRLAPLQRWIESWPSGEIADPGHHVAFLRPSPAS